MKGMSKKKKVELQENSIYMAKKIFNTLLVEHWGVHLIRQCVCVCVVAALNLALIYPIISHKWIVWRSYNHSGDTFLNYIN